LKDDIEIDDVVKCVETVSLILRMSNEAKIQMLSINGYEKIFEFVGKQANKSQPLLKAIISIATENTDKTLDQNLEVKFVNCLTLLYMLLISMRFYLIECTNDCTID